MNNSFFSFSLVVFVEKVLRRLFPSVPCGQEKRVPVAPASGNPAERVATTDLRGRSATTLTGEGLAGGGEGGVSDLAVVMFCPGAGSSGLAVRGGDPARPVSGSARSLCPHCGLQRAQCGEKPVLAPPLKTSLSSLCWAETVLVPVQVRKQCEELWPGRGEDPL